MSDPMSKMTADDWKGLADEYKDITRETSARPMACMLERANALFPFSQATGILDNGCGPGPVMSRLLEDYHVPPSCSLICADYSEAMIEQVKKTKEARVKENSGSPWSRVETFVENAMDLQSVQSSSVSHVTAGLVYFMVPEPQKALSESLRVLTDDGVLVCSTWQGSQWMDLMNLVPRVRSDKEPLILPKEWTDVELLKVELQKAGFRDVECHEVQTSMSFAKLADLCEFFITKMPHMVNLTADFSKEEHAQLRKLMVEEGRKSAPSDPGQLQGVSLVAVGRK